MMLGDISSHYAEIAAAIFLLYFVVTVAAVYFYMFWTGRLIRLERSATYIFLYTSLSMLTLVFFGDIKLSTIGSILMLPLSFSVKNALPILFWLFVLVVSVLSSKEKSR